MIFFKRCKPGIIGCKAFILLLIVCLSLYSSCSQILVYAAEPLQLQAEAAILIDMDRGQVLYEKNADKQFFDPMLPKLMTSLLCIDKSSANPKVTVSINAAEAMGDGIEIEAGKQYTINDLIAATVLTSSHNTAIALSEYLEPDMTKFVEMMNSKAASLNMKNTLFTNSHGKYDDNQYTSARDIITFLRYALSIKEFKEFFSMKIYLTQSLSDGFFHNKNLMFWNYDYTSGGKVAMITENYMSTITMAVKDNRSLLSVILYTSPNNYVNENKKLLNYGFEEYRKGILVSKGQVLHQITVGNQPVNLVSSSDVYYTFPQGDAYIEDVENIINENIGTSVQKGDFLGTVKYILKDGTVISVPLQAEVSINIDENFFTQLLNKVKDNAELYSLVIVLISIEAVLFVLFIIRLFFRAIKIVKNSK